MITLGDYWNLRDIKYAADLTDEIRANAKVTVDRANLLLDTYVGRTGDFVLRHITSGWRPPAVNAITPNAAKKSKHMTGQAVDISDPDGDLDDWCMNHTAVLEDIGLWMEHPAATKGWTHIQCVAPKSGSRCFYP